MSHGDEVVKLPKGFLKLAKTKDNIWQPLVILKKIFMVFNFIQRLFIQLQEKI